MHKITVLFFLIVILWAAFLFFQFCMKNYIYKHIYKKLYLQTAMFAVWEDNR